MRRGMVIKLNEDYAIVATDDSNFIKIRIKKGMQVGQKIFFFNEDIISSKGDNKKRSAMPNYIKAVAVLAACIVVAVMINNPFVKDVHLLYAMVSLDINPSFELGVDEAFNVVQVNAMNEESKEILDKELIGKPLKIAVSKILSDVEASGFILAADNAVLVSTVNLKNENNEPLQKVVAKGVYLAMTEKPVYNNTKVIFINADKDDLEAAEEEKISVGKYRLLEMSDNKIDKTTITEVRVSDLIREKEIKDDFKEDETIQIIDGEDLQRLIKIEEDIDSVKDLVDQKKDALNNDEIEKIADLVDNVENLENKLIHEDSELEEIYQIIEALYKVIELEEDWDEEYDGEGREELLEEIAELEDKLENEELSEEEIERVENDLEALYETLEEDWDDEDYEDIEEREELLKEIAELEDKLENEELSEEEIEYVENDLEALYETLEEDWDEELEEESDEFDDEDEELEEEESDEFDDEDE